MKEVLFVCTGNTCRSPMAEAIMKELLQQYPRLIDQVHVQSAGTTAFCGDTITDTAEEALEEMNIHAAHHRSRRLTSELAEQVDLILTMEARHLQMVLFLCPEAVNKAHTLKGFASGVEGMPHGRIYDIPDPFGQPIERYRMTAEEIKKAIQTLLQRLDEKWGGQ